MTGYEMCSEILMNSTDLVVASHKRSRQEAE